MTSHSIEVVTELSGHEDRAWHVAWNPVHPLLASCSTDKSVRLYSYTTSSSSELSFKPSQTIPTGHSRTVRAVAWSPGGKTLATASFDSTVGIWERSAGEDEDNEGEWECVSTLEGHESECKSVGYSYDGALLASCSRDKSVWIWEVQPDNDFECMSVLMEHTQDVKCVAWHPKEEILASASYDDTIKLYLDDPSDDWYPFQTLTGHTSTVWSLSFSPCGNYLASASDDKSIRIWARIKKPPLKPSANSFGGGGNYDSWECRSVMAGVHERSIYSISWGPGVGGGEGRHLGWLASTGGDGKINIWEISVPESETPISTISSKLIATRSAAHGVADVNSIAWCPRTGFQDLLATTGDDAIVRVWKVASDVEEVD